MWRFDRRVLQAVVLTALVVGWGAYLLAYVARWGPGPLAMVSFWVRTYGRLLFVVYTLTLVYLLLAIRFRWRHAGAVIFMVALLSFLFVSTGSVYLSVRFENGTDGYVMVHVVRLGRAEVRRSLGPGEGARVVLAEAENKEMLDRGQYYILAYDRRGNILHEGMWTGEELFRETITILKEGE